MNPAGQVAIVTGGGSGLGEATARGLAAKGAKVAIFDLQADKAEKVAAEIGGAAFECNVSSAEGGEKAFAEAAAKLGPARILVNCAGIAIAMKTVGKDGPHPLDLYKKVLEVNLVGSFNMIRLFAARTQDLEPLAGGERGVIVNTASVAAFDGQIGQVAYAASKGGIVSMTLPLAREFARLGIRVMTIAPGTFDTPLLANLPQAARESLAQQVPFPSRLGRPEEYAALVRHIFENEMLNGEVIRLDGAIRMAPK
jgi:NAD(P)-dependent dehydrogenase (short-subunit alcohol dehydrogenase family)